MNNEIKEILDFLDNDNKERPFGISNHDLKILRDYITNLQEENEKYKKIFEGKEYFSATMPEDIEFVILTKENYDRQQKDIQIELIDYKSRCEKAIKILKDTSEDMPETLLIETIDYARHILNGGAE